MVSSKMFAKVLAFLFVLVVAGGVQPEVFSSNYGRTDRYQGVIGTTESGRQTPEGFRSDYKYYPAAAGWFKYHDVPSSWRDARLRCQLEGAVLASPLTSAIAKVMAHLAGSNLIYTGINDIFSKGDFYSIEGVPLSKMNDVFTDFEYYYTNQNQQPECLGVSLQNYNLVIYVKCGVPKNYICYKADQHRNLTVNECGTIDNEYQLSPETGKCYKFHRTPRDWSRAYMACAAEGGHLAIINSQEEANVLSKLFKSVPSAQIKNLHKGEGYYAFIGFHNWGENGDFLTIHGQTLKEAGYSGWSTKYGEPNNVTSADTNYVGEYCGSINIAATLNDIWCDYVISFICEKDPTF